MDLSGKTPEEIMTHFEEYKKTLPEALQPEASNIFLMGLQCGGAFEDRRMFANFQLRRNLECQHEHKSKRHDKRLRK